MTDERAIRIATASVEMEGFEVTDRCRELCRDILSGKLSYAEYLNRLTEKKEPST